MIYNTVIGGVPNEVDVLAAVADMENLYDACSETGRLADAAFNFMKAELTVGDMIEIEEKISTQAPVSTLPPPAVVLTSAAETKLEIVLRKFKEFQDLESMTNSKALELKLLTQGACSDYPDARELLSSKFDELIQLIKSGDQAQTRGLLSELKLIVEGAISGA